MELTKELLEKRLAIFAKQKLDAVAQINALEGARLTVLGLLEELDRKDDKKENEGGKKLPSSSKRKTE